MSAAQYFYDAEFIQLVLRLLELNTSTCHELVSFGHLYSYLYI